MTPVRPSATRGGWEIGRLAGIPIILGMSWFVITALIVVAFGPQIASSAAGFPTWTGYVVALGYALLLLLSVLAHEAAHALVARGFGYQVDRIVADLWGGHTVYDAAGARPARTAAIAAAGPLTNAVLAGVGYLLSGLELPPLVGLLVGAFAWANGFVAVFNMLPGLPLDGGHLVDALVWGVTGRRSAGLVVAGWCGRVVAVAAVVWFVVVPMASGRTPSTFTVLWALVIGWFLWQGATGAIRGGRAQGAIASVAVGAVVRPALVVPFTATAQSVADAIEQAPYAYEVVPVGPDGVPLGLVDVAALVSIEPDRRDSVPVASVTVRQPTGWIVQADPAGDVTPVVAAIGARHAEAGPGALQKVLVVDRAGRVVGTVTVEALNEAFNRGRQPSS